jgi:hypothetical protein
MACVWGFKLFNDMIQLLRLCDDRYELWAGREGEMIMDHVTSNVKCGKIVINCESAGKER